MSFTTVRSNDRRTYQRMCLRVCNTIDAPMMCEYIKSIEIDYYFDRAIFFVLITFLSL